ncbi:aromatic amino acid lyase [Streptomyces sp. ME18-1-4]|uniref:aromatic amino acid lyase n=1 Tax=Streptomyces sp. ME18-1-4 TaxID=3028685 RepID=UPI0029B2643E|nr:aromatic amino acid lyase [Streptomyces sp. ME18-1-4]MDX3244938.1 aromatic amino acid lyase [Streptomyces sp. ME18-1-4]
MDTTANGARVVLNGTTLTVGELIALADGEAVPTVAPEARERAVRSWRTARRLAATGRLYGRGTGVGAQRSVPVDEEDEAAHGLRLLRSHAGGAGALLPARQVRAMLAVRANQLLAGGSGIQPDFIDALTAALRLGVHPAVNEYGGVGTGDLTALAQTGLTLIGERPWAGEEPGGSTGDPEPDGEAPGSRARAPELKASARLLPGLGAPTAPTPASGPVSDPVSVPVPVSAPGHASAPVPVSASVSDSGPVAVAVPVSVPGSAPVSAPVSVAGPIPVPASVSVRGPVPASALAPGSAPVAVATSVSGSAPAPAPVLAFDATPGPASAAATTSTGLPAPVTLQPGDALALLSSNALALGQAALAQGALDTLLRATHAVAALSLAAVSGSPEAYAAPVHALRPYPGAARAAGEVRRLLGLPDRPTHHPGGRVQDPFGFRAFPQAHGCALDACERLREILEVEVNCPSENPLMDPGSTAAYHHGGFFAAPLGLALDAANLALLQTAQLSAARLAAFGDPGLTGLPAFLGAGPASSSGTMILEYTANSALAELRSCTTPASAGHAVLSRGLEEAASFAGQAARQTLRATDAYTTVLACELVAAVRALRMHPHPHPHPHPPPHPHAHSIPPPTEVFAVAAAALPAGTEDRPLTGDVTTAARLLSILAEL